MPDFFFNIHDANGVIPDEEGKTFEDVHVAHREALESARDLLVQSLKSQKVVRDMRIEVTDENGAAVETVMLRDLIEKFG